MDSLRECGYRRLLKDSLFKHPFESRERSITICFTSFIVVVFIVSLFISFFKCIRRRSNPSPSFKSPTSVDGSQLTTLPVFIFGDSSSYPSCYSFTSSFELKNCAICLAEFEHGEEVRVLPNCKHLFHKECIDQWVPVRSLLCPVCRHRTMEGERLPARRPGCLNDWATDRALILALGLASNIPVPSQLA